MSLFNNEIRMGASAAGTYEIERSLRFNKADSAACGYTPASDGDRQKWTFSCWIKRTYDNITGDGEVIWAGKASGSNNDAFSINSSEKLQFKQEISNTGRTVTSTVELRDTNAWYHIVLAQDTTQATASNRIKIWINGVQSALTGTYPNQNSNGNINRDILHYLGATKNTSNTNPFAEFSGYITEVHFVDGITLDADSFGETNSDTGQWIPKKYSGSHGTNGFYVNFSDNSDTTAATLGKDSSSNSNNVTPTGVSVAAGIGNDSFEDTPTNNYCILSPLSSNATTLNNGNLYWVGDTGTANFLGAKGSFGIKSGKWYWEHTCTTAGYSLVGIKPVDKNYNNPAGDDEYADGAVTYAGWSGSTMLGDGTTGTSWETYGNTWTTNDVIGIAFDADNNAIYFSKNGTWQNSATAAEIAAGTTTNAAYTGLTSEYYPLFTSYSSGAGHANFGQRPFIHTAPTGFKTLCTANLPEPTIKNPTDYFNTVLYTGTITDTSTQSITGVGFQPNLTWIKRRDGANSHQWVDSVRGAGKWLESSGQDVEGTSNTNGVLTAFGSDGFTLTGGSTNAKLCCESGHTYAAWNWKESASAGFDIVLDTGTGSDKTVAHSLGVKPDMIIRKARGREDNWCVYHKNLDGDEATEYLELNSNNGQQNYHEIWNDTPPTSSVFTVGHDTAVNEDGTGYVTYLFSSVENYSKIGTYKGQGGSSEIPFIWTGFKPALVFGKGVDTDNWFIFDNKRNTYNPVNTALYPSSSGTENTVTADAYDFLSNGFRFTGNGNFMNESGVTYIFLAIAETPFKYATAR